MHGRNSYEDELARRRAARDRQAAAPARSQAPEENEEPPPKFDWRDIFAMIIAAYQILFPMLLIMIGALLVTYLIFRFAFS